MSDWVPYLYHADCVDILPSIPTESVELICCDPPFAVTGKHWDKQLPWRVIWKELWRILKPTGNIVIHASASFYFDMIANFRNDLRYDWTWHKWTGRFNSETNFPTMQYTNAFQAKKQPLRSTEGILIFNRHPEQAIYNPTIDPAFQPGSTPNENLWYTPRPGDFTRPIGLVNYLVKTFSNEGDTVLDFCMSDGQTGMSCKELKRQFIGIEIDASHFELAVRRLSEQTEKMVSVSWNEAQQAFLIRWRHAEVNEVVSISVTNTRSKDEALKEALRLKDDIQTARIETSAQFRERTAKSNNLLGIPGICPKWNNKRQELNICAFWPSPKTGKRREKIFRVQQGLYQVAVEEAVQWRMKKLKSSVRPNYIPDYVVLKLQQWEQQKRQKKDISV